MAQRMLVFSGVLGSGTGKALGSQLPHQPYFRGVQQLGKGLAWGFWVPLGLVLPSPPQQTSWIPS